MSSPAPLPTVAASPTAPIVVVGAGCVGLAVALQLLQAGYSNVTIVAKDTTPKTTSDQAGALWRPFGEVSPSNQATFTRWGAQTFDFLNALRQQHGSAATGILLVSGFEVFGREQPRPFWANDVINFQMLDTAALRAVGIGAPHTHGFAYTSIVVEMNVYLQWMHREFFRQGGQLRMAEVGSLAEVQSLYPTASLIVNCTGLGSLALVGDKTLFPVAGHILRVRAPTLQHFFMDADNTTYIFPRSSDAIVGGTYFKYDGCTTPSLQNRNDILARAEKLVPELSQAEVVGEYVGLRPYREVTRLEVEWPAGKARPPNATTPRSTGKPVTVPVIHNYGHGGSGVTLHWGCGVTVMELVRQILPPPPTPAKRISSKL